MRKIIIKKCLILAIISLFFGVGTIPSTIGIVSYSDIIKNNSTTNIFEGNIDSLSTYSAYHGETVTIFGNGFGSSPGHVVVTGLHVTAASWTETEIQFIVPEYAASGFIYIRDSAEIKSNSVDFTVNYGLFEGQFEPYGLNLEETGLFGPAFLVETDGSYLYGITGFETLCTYKIYDNKPYELCSIVSLAQRVGDLKIHDGYLFCSGDHGLYIFRCASLQQGDTSPLASIAGGSYMTLDVKEKTGQPVEGTVIAICEYLPTVSSYLLRVPFFKFESEELIHLGTFSRTVSATERQHAIAIDPLNPKVYVSGYETLFSENKYILEIDISDLANPFINHKEQTGDLLAFDMDARNDVLWIGILSSGTDLFRTYTLHPGNEHLMHDQTIQGIFGLGRTTRVKVIDDNATVGVAWSGARPDVFLLDTFNSGTSPLASTDSLDWAFDVSGYTQHSDEHDGKIIVADEWGGFLTYEFSFTPESSISHQQDYHWAPASAMTENLYLTDDCVYAANRGAGIWSVDRSDVSDESLWKHSEWDWSLEDPQPHPISALCTREDPLFGTLIAARGNNKAMAWGEIEYGILYQETSIDIKQLAISDGIDPPGGFLSGGPGFSVLWPETDLVYMATGTDGFRAFVVNPETPSITIHKDCLLEGFGNNNFGTNLTASDLYYYRAGSDQKIIVGSTLGLFVNEPTITIFDIAYPDGIPDRDHPERDIQITKEGSLQCLKGKSISYFDVSSSGMIAAASNLGLAVFHISWIPELNNMSDSQAWNLIKIPENTYIPWWDNSWSASFSDVCFGDENTIFAVKKPQGKNPGGVWCLDIEIDWDGYTHNSVVKGYYPGVQCGIDYTHLLQGWGNPDIVTIHHPYGLVADGNTVYVTGWSGKIDRLTFNVENNPPSIPDIQGPSNGKVGTSYDYKFSSSDPDGDNVYYYIQWGDGSIEEWIGQYSSGEQISISHTWTKQGNFTIKAKVKDVNNGVSNWGFLEISMPKNKTIDMMFLQYFWKLLERFPIFELILRE